MRMRPPHAVGGGGGEGEGADLIQELSNPALLDLMKTALQFHQTHSSTSSALSPHIEDKRLLILLNVDRTLI